MKKATTLKGLLLGLTAMVFLAVQPTLAQDNIITAGDFPDDTLPAAWSSYIHSDAGVSADVGVVDNQGAITNISGAGAGGQTWHIQFNQIFTAEQIAMLEAGEIYTISFDAKSNAPERPVKVYFGEDGGSFTALAAIDTTIGTSMKTYNFNVEVSQTFNAMKLGFEVGLSSADFIIDNVSVTKGEYVPSTFIVDGGFSADTLSDAWSSYLADFAGVSGDVSVVDGEAAITGLAGAGGATWHVQFNQILSDEQIAMLNVGQSYVLSFDARSSEADRPARVFFGQNEEPFSALVSENIEVGTSMETYEIEFNLNATFSVMKLGFELGLSNADFFLDNVQLEEGDEPAPTNPEFGDNKILFVDGPNVLIPRIDGSAVEDVVEEGNIVHQFNGGAFYEQGYFWDMGGFGGVDFTQNMADVDTVYLRIRINPAEHTDAEGNLRATGSLMLADVTNGTNSNLQWGIAYPLGEFYDNEWHDLVLPLPKPTIAEHDSALKGLDLNGDPLPESEQYNEAQMKWTFPTAWNGSQDVSPNDPELGGDPEWENLGRIALRLGNDRSGSFFVDEFYIGSASGTDLSVATALPDLPGNVVAESVNGEVNISWDHNSNSNIYNYELYYSGSEIANIEDSGVKFIGSFRTSDPLTYSHGAELPHPSVSGVDYHYAVVPTTQYSIKSPTNFTGQSVLATGNVMPYIFELSEGEEQQIISDLESGTIDGENWPLEEYVPFTLSGEEVAETDGSAQVWMAFGRAEGFQTMYVFVEAYDDDILAGSAANPSEMFGTTVYPRINQDPTWVPDISEMDTDLEWNYYLKDQLKIHFGSYGVDFVSGSDNEFRSRGATPDYFLSIQPKMSTESTDPGPDGALTRFWVTEHNYDDPDVVYNTLYYNSDHPFTFSTLYENIMEGETRIGWRAVVAFDVNDLLVANDESGNPVDEVFEFPSSDELKYIPLRLELWDKDSGDSGNWWENPSHVFSYPTAIAAGGNNEWEDAIGSLGAAAMAGIGVPTSIEGPTADVPKSFSLEQNYPNPFNPTTKITFNLPSTAEVNLTIFNVLGQKVKTLVQSQQLSAGSHTVNFDASSLSSGMYIYRIEAGAFQSSKKMMLIK